MHGVARERSVRCGGGHMCVTWLGKDRCGVDGNT